jgi:hypothetical protein
MKPAQLEIWITIAFSFLLIIFNIWMIGTGSQPWIISSLNIFFHEAGHFIFSFFGRFIMVLGGTLGELLMPLIFVIYFSLHRRIAGVIFSLWWLTTALYSVAIYIGDARARTLTIIGGQEGHDWAYLLRTTGLLQYDIFISKLVIIIALSITAYMIVLLHRYYELSQGKIIS